jgi:uncharacterized membrane protein
MHEVLAGDRWISLDELLALMASAPPTAIEPAAEEARGLEQHPSTLPIPPIPQEEEFYFGRGGQSQGPHKKSVIRQFALAGIVTGDDMGWKEGLADWVPLRQLIPDLPFPLQTTYLPPGFESARGSLAGQKPQRTTDQLGQIFGFPDSPAHGRDLMRIARECLRGRWGGAIGISLLAYIIISVPGQIFYQLGELFSRAEEWLWIGVAFYGASLLCSVLSPGPFTLGQSFYFLAAIRRSAPRVGLLFKGCSFFGKSVALYLLSSLFIFLWTLLLIVPGIIAAYSYAMAYFIVADDPSVRPLDAIRRSKQMMVGQKWKLACLQGRFIGWALLGLLTCGIGLLWVYPYYMASAAAFYEDLKRRPASAP